MTQQAKIPDLETRERHVANMREVCRRLDAVTIKLDELIAKIEADIRHSPLTAYRLGNYKHSIESSKILLR